MCSDADYSSIKRSTWLCAERLENNGGWTEAGKRRLQKIGTDERGEPQRVRVMKYWATLNSQTERKQYQDSGHRVDHFIYAHFSTPVAVR